MKKTVGLTSNLSEDEIFKQVNALPDAVRPNGILLLDKALFVRKPFKVEFIRYTKDQLYHFVSFLQNRLEGFPTAVVDMAKYVPGEAWTIFGTPKNLSSSSASQKDMDEASGSGP